MSDMFHVERHFPGVHQVPKAQDINANPGVAFTILGEPVSLKNNKRIGQGRTWNNPKYAKWAVDAAVQIPVEARRLALGGPTQPLRAIISVWYASWRPDVDLEGLYDILQTAGVVSNDRWIREKLVYGAHIDASNPRIEIEIYEI